MHDFFCLSFAALADLRVACVDPVGSEHECGHGQPVTTPDVIGNLCQHLWHCPPITLSGFRFFSHYEFVVEE